MRKVPTTLGDISIEMLHSRNCSSQEFRGVKKFCDC